MKIFSSRKRIVGTFAVVGLAGLAFATLGRGDDGEDGPATVTVERADIVDRALAVGQIEPDVEIDVKSQVSGVVKKLHADVGDWVQAGTPLMEVQPNPTPLQLVEARRRVEMDEAELPYLEREYRRMKELRDRGIVTVEEFESARRSFEQAELRVQLARERLALLEEGRVASDAGDVETTIKSPITGFILEKTVEVGDPVVPLTPSQEGTVLMSMAAMDDLIFRGTVDEIDVGRLEEGMEAEIQVGALPDVGFTGTLGKISLKARKEENSTVFPVEIAIRVPEDGEGAGASIPLRAGYSANAEIIVERRTNVLSLPERVLEFEGDSARVRVPGPDGEPAWRTVETGLSDAVRIEIVSGLDEGQEVIEPEPREID